MCIYVHILHVAAEKSTVKKGGLEDWVWGWVDFSNALMVCSNTYWPCFWEIKAVLVAEEVADTLLLEIFFFNMNLNIYITNLANAFPVLKYIYIYVYIH